MIKMKNRLAVLILISIMIFNISACSNSNNTIPDADSADKEDLVAEIKDVLFEQSLSALDKNLDRWGSRFFWSPDGNYAVAEAMSSKPETEYSPAIILVDIKNNRLIKLKDGYIASEPAWSKDSKKFTLNINDELVIYNTEDQSYDNVSDKGYMPQFSPDNSKLIYMNEGLWIYNVTDKDSTQISKGKYDASPIWFSDNNRVFYFRDNGKNLGDGAGNQQVLSVLDTSVENKFDDVKVDMKGKFRSAKWLEKDEQLFIYAGWDDGHTYHILNLSNNELIKDIASELDYIAIDENEKKLLNIKGYPESSLLGVYDYNMKKLSDSYIDHDKAYEAARSNLGIVGLKGNRVTYLHVNQEENKGAIMISYLSDGRQTRITEYGNYSTPFVSPDGRLLAYYEDDQTLKIRAVDQLKEVDVVKVENDKNALSGLLQMLPNRTGAEWKYNGFAEHSHSVRIDAINHLSDSQIQYQISGKVDDMSDGEGTKDFRINIEYIVSKDGLKEIVKKAEVLPHKIMEFDVLRYPLIKGNTWTQQVHINDSDVELKAEIIEQTVDEEDNTKVIKVQYTAQVPGMPNDMYKEIRTYQEGKGLIYFENTYDYDIDFIYTLFQFNK